MWTQLSEVPKGASSVISGSHLAHLTEEEAGGHRGIETHPRPHGVRQVGTLSEVPHRMRLGGGGISVVEAGGARSNQTTLCTSKENLCLQNASAGGGNSAAQRTPSMLVSCDPGKSLLRLPLHLKCGRTEDKLVLGPIQVEGPSIIPSL